MRDHWVAWVWVAVNTLLVVAAWRLARRLYPGDTAAQLLVHTTVLAVACVTVCGVVLGASGLLTPTNYLALVTAAAGGVLLAGRPSAVGSGAAGLTAAPQEGRAWVVVWGAWVGLLLGLPLAATVGTFPADFDALWYHLPFVSHWLQAHSLYAPDACFWFYPANGELVTLWVVGPFSGDFLAGLTNLPAVVLLAAAAVECGAAAGLPRPAAYLTGMVVVTHRVTELQVSGIGNDLWTAALMLAALWYGLRAAAAPSRPALVFCGACVGMLAGVKYYALGYALLTGTVVLARVLDEHGRRAALRAGVVVVLAATLVGGYWYARNALVTGSPLYPKAITLSGSDTYSQKHPGLWQSSFFGNGDPAVPSLTSAAVAKYYGPGAWVAFVAGPIVAGWLTASSVRDRIGPGGARAAVAAMVSGSGLLLGVTPNAIEDDPGTLNAIRWGYPLSRFALCYVSLSLVALALVVQAVFDRIGVSPGRPAAGYRARAAACGPRAALGVLLAAQLWHVASGRADWPWLDGLLVVGNVVLVGVGVAVGVRSLPVLGRRVVLGVVWAAAAGAAAAGAERLSINWHRDFARHYDSVFKTTVFSELEAADPRAVRIGFHGYLGYPFFGSHRQFAVCQPFFAPSASWLTDYLRDRRVTHLAVLRPPTAQALEKGKYFWWFDQCLAESPGCFRPVGDGSDFTLFVIPPECR